jgi:hypothetical protein
MKRTKYNPLAATPGDWTARQAITGRNSTRIKNHVVGEYTCMTMCGLHLEPGTQHASTRNGVRIGADCPHCAARMAKDGGALRWNRKRTGLLESKQGRYGLLRVDASRWLVLQDERIAAVAGSVAAAKQIANRIHMGGK